MNIHTYICIVIDPPLLACIQVLMFSRLFRHTGSGSLREEAVEGSLSWRHRRDHLARGHSRVFSIGGVWWRYSWLHGSGSRVKRETVERGPLLPVSWSFVLPFTLVAELSARSECSLSLWDFGEPCQLLVMVPAVNHSQLHLIKWCRTN